MWLSQGCSHCPTLPAMMQLALVPLRWTACCTTILAGGDFNIIRNPLEKSNDRFDSIWPTLFNACIESLSLRVSTDTTFTLHTPSLIVVVAGRGALGPHDAPSSLYLAMGAAGGVLGPRDRPFSMDSVVGAAKGVLEPHEIPS
jgi:hypothetical protein